MPVSLHILSASSLPQGQLQEAAASVERVFRLPVRLSPADLVLEKAFDRSREQYNSTALLAQLLAAGIPRGEKRIAVVDVDLYIPVLTFVYGEAQLSGETAVVSTHRLHNPYYGLDPDPRLLLERLEKEAVHELGHTFGLYHCRQFECVMRASTYVEEIDLKRLHPCPSCEQALREGILRLRVEAA